MIFFVAKIGTVAIQVIMSLVKLPVQVERRFCPHCDKYVAYKTYQTHKRRYFDSSTSQWMKQAKSLEDRNADHLRLDNRENALSNEGCSENPPNLYPQVKPKGK